MKFKVDFANGRCTTISCDSNEEAKKELLSVQKRFNSKISSVNDQPIEKLALGGVLLATILGGILGNQVAKSGVSKTAKTIKSTTKKTISKTKKEFSEFRSASSKSKKYATGGGIPSDYMYKEVYDYIIGGDRPKSMATLKKLTDAKAKKMSLEYGQNLSINKLFQDSEDVKASSDNYRYATGGGTPRKTKINKKYTHFAVSKETGKIRDAWETLDDIETLKYYANIDLKDNDLNPKDYNILSNKTLIRRGVNPYDSDNWTKPSEYAKGGEVKTDYMGYNLETTIQPSGATTTIASLDGAYKFGTFATGKENLNSIEKMHDKIRKHNKSSFATGGGVGSMDKWFVTIDYYEPSAKEDRFGNKLRYSMKTFKVEASSKEEAIKKATNLYNSVNANKNRQIEQISPINLSTLPTIKASQTNLPIFAKGGLPKNNPFNLYNNNSKQQQEATIEIQNGIDSGKINLENLDNNNILEKYRRIGADDSETKEIIYLILQNKYAMGGKIGDEVYAYFTHNYMGYQMVESPAMGEVYNGKIIDVITENNTKKYVLKFENGVTKKISESLFNDYIFQNKFAMGGMSPQLAIADQISQRLPATTAAIDKKFAERVNPTQPSIWEDRGLQKMAKGGGLNKFNFDKAELEKISSEYYNVYLYKNEKLIYKATVPTDDALMIADKYKNITLKKSFATGGTIGQEITFKHWTGDIRNGIIKEDLGKGNFEVSSGFGNVLVNAEDFISPAQKMAKGGYTTPSYNIKTTGVYRFTTKDKTYILKSYLFERQNNTEDLIQIQDELRGELGAIIIKNSVWSRLSKGFPVRGISSKGNVTGTLTRIADIIDANKYAKGGSTNERNFVNKSEDYEVRYARKNNPSRVGYKGNKKFELGGGIDLFEDYDKAPPAVAKLMEKYEEAFEDGDYEKLAEAHKAFEKIGYTFDYYLDGVAYDLRPIGTKGKAE